MPDSPDTPPFHNDPDPADEAAPGELPLPAGNPEAKGRGDIHIPGAGTLGIFLLVASLSILFIASMLAYLLIRFQTENWARSMPHVPRSLWFSTLVILASSITIQIALNCVRRDNDKRLIRWLRVTFLMGVLFLILQTLNWVEFYLAIRDKVFNGAYLGMFFVLTGLHAAHVIGGLIPLGIVIHRSRLGRYSRNFHPGVRYITIYWHFLDVIWVVLFSLIYF